MKGLKKNVIGFMVCGPGEADRYLLRALESFKRLCDGAMIACCNAGDAEKQMITEFGFEWYEDNREWGLHQPAIKTRLLARIAEKMAPDWIMPLDADEEHCEAFTRAELDRLMHTNAIAYYFRLVNLWDDPSHYKQSITFWNVRLFKYAPEFGMQFLNRNVHCGLAPPAAYKYGRYAPFPVKHYGLMNAEDRAAKVKRYEKYDPNADKVGIGGWYEALKSTGAGSVYNEGEVLQSLRDYVKEINQKDKKISTKHMPSTTFTILRRKKDGKEFEVQTKDLPHYPEAKFERVTEIENPANPVDNVEAPVIRRPEPKIMAEVQNTGPGGAPEVQEPQEVTKAEEPSTNFTCDVCGVAAVSDRGLKRHKAMKHKDAKDSKK
jgi:hypothetical protein